MLRVLGLVPLILRMGMVRWDTIELPANIVPLDPRSLGKYVIFLVASLLVHILRKYVIFLVASLLFHTSRISRH